MPDDELKTVFSKLSVLGKSVEQKMYEFLLKDINNDFKDLVTWQTHTGGKRLRPALTLLFAEAFGSSSGDSEVLSAAAGIELIHTYSLILDDIIDRGDLRRGQPTTRAKYGDEFAILSAIIHREAVFEAAKATGKHMNQSIAIYSQTIRRLTEGERLDVLFEQKEERENEYFKKYQFNEVSLADYRRMITGKTAALLAAACRLGAIVGGASLDEQACAEKYGWSTGVAFQIADDYLDIFSAVDTFGKVIYKDIIEQKLGNFVIVQALKMLDDKDAQLLREFITDKNLTDENRVEKCIPLIEKSQVKKHVMNEAEKWSHKAKMILSTIEFENEEKKTLLNKIADFSVKRAY
ncbi:MAG: polyprenyl synthetase family protein [Candidatus Hodarchaeales archaeon]|jgi:geranylgeranyl diphosphate synthase type I